VKGRFFIGTTSPQEYNLKTGEMALIRSGALATGLYRKLGFEVEGKCLKDMKVADGKYIDSVLMYKFV